MKLYLAFFSLVIMFLLNSCKQKTTYPIGKSSGDSIFVVYDDISKAKSYFTFVANNSKIEEHFVNYRIVSQKDLVSEESYYMLLATSRDEKYKIGLLLYNEEGHLSITSQSLQTPSVICSGDCVDACNPQRSNGKWICSDGCKAECSKTETISYEENNYTTPIQAFLEKY